MKNSQKRNVTSFEVHHISPSSNIYGGSCILLLLPFFRKRYVKIHHSKLVWIPQSWDSPWVECPTKKSVSSMSPKEMPSSAYRKKNLTVFDAHLGVLGDLHWCVINRFTGVMLSEFWCNLPVTFPTLLVFFSCGRFKRCRRTSGYQHHFDLRPRCGFISILFLQLFNYYSAPVHLWIDFFQWFCFSGTYLTPFSYGQSNKILQRPNQRRIIGLERDAGPARGFKHMVIAGRCNKHVTYCWWLKSGVHQLRLVVDTVIYRVLYMPGGCLGVLNHQQYVVGRYH